MSTFRRTAAASVLTALLSAAPARAQQDCRKEWHDASYTMAASKQGVELRAARFCLAETYDHVVQVCWELQNRNAHRVRVEFDLTASCSDGSQGGDDHRHTEELDPGQRWGGGESWLMCQEFFAPCGPNLVPTRVGWKATVVDLDQAEAAKKLAETEAETKRAEQARQARQADEARADAQRRADQQARTQQEAEQRQDRVADDADRKAQAEEARRLEAERREQERLARIQARREARAEEERKIQEASANQTAAIAGAMADLPDRVAPPPASTRRMTFQVGLYFGSYPVVGDATWSGTSVPAYSERTDAMGAGGTATAEAWMLDYPGFGAALYAGGAYGFGATAGLEGFVQQYEFGARGRLGSRANVGLLAEASRQVRKGLSSFYFSDGLTEYYVSGSGDATLMRAGVGAFLCTEPTANDGCLTWGELWLLQDQADGLTMKVLRGVLRYQGFAVSAEYGKDYPLMGAPAYTFEGKSAGEYLSVAIVKEWDWWPGTRRRD